MEYEKIEEKISEFDSYIKQTMDLLKDAYRWKIMAKHCDNEEMKAKYMQVSDTLLNLYLIEHANIDSMFKDER